MGINQNLKKMAYDEMTKNSQNELNILEKSVKLANVVCKYSKIIADVDMKQYRKTHCLGAIVYY